MPPQAAPVVTYRGAILRADLLGQAVYSQEPQACPKNRFSFPRDCGVLPQQAQTS